MAFYTYIMACCSNTAIYVGATGNLRERIAQHKLGKGSAHTKKYNITKLVYFEIHETLNAALAREKTLKRWRRAWKEDLIKAANPSWSDLSMEASFL